MTHPSPRQFLLTPPQDLEAARAFGLPLALMAWQLDGQGRLTQAPLPPQAQGGLMLVGASQPIQEGADPRRAAQEILAQCRSRVCTGVILDPELPPSPFLAQLIRLVDFIDQPSARSRRSARSCAPASRTASWRQSSSHTTRSRAARRAA